MSYEPGLILDDALQAGLPAVITLADYNEAVSLQSKLKRYIEETNTFYKQNPGRPSPFNNLTVTLIRPSTLRLDKGERPAVISIR